MRLLACLLVALSFIGFVPTVEAQCYSTGYSAGYANYGHAGYSYTYYPAGYWNGRYFPAGHYAWINGTWYRQGYGYEYGYLAAPSYAAVYTQAPCYAPQAAPPPPTDLNKLAVELLARHLVTSQTQQLTGQPPALAAPPTEVFPGYYPKATATPALTSEEVAKLKAILSGK
jgi:hypothetical protein